MAEQDLSTRDLAGASATDETTAADEPITRDPAGGQSTQPHDGASAAGEAREPLLDDDQSESYTSRWHEIQASFVDRPREAVAEADTLVADLMQRLAGTFSSERERLESQWDRGDDVSTE